MATVMKTRGISISPELDAALVQLAQERGLTISATVQQLIRKALAEQPSLKSIQAQIQALDARINAGRRSAPYDMFTSKHLNRDRGV